MISKAVFPALFAILAFGAVAPSLSPVQAAPADLCAAIADDSERLGCYDAIFRDVGTIPEGDVLIESERLIPAMPTGREPATMMVSCVDDRLVVSFAFAGQLVSNTSDIAAVTFQVDSNGTVVRTLTANDSNTELSFGPGGPSTAFLNSLAGGVNLKVRMTPVRQRSLTVDFRLQPHDAAIGALRETCR